MQRQIRTFLSSPLIFGSTVDDDAILTERTLSGVSVTQQSTYYSSYFVAPYSAEQIIRSALQMGQ
jgi:hypothetical protein